MVPGTSEIGVLENLRIVSGPAVCSGREDSLLHVHVPGPCNDLRASSMLHGTLKTPDHRHQCVIRFKSHSLLLEAATNNKAACLLKTLATWCVLRHPGVGADMQ
jgi:hypothetical protein